MLFLLLIVTEFVDKQPVDKFDSRDDQSPCQ